MIELLVNNGIVDVSGYDPIKTTRFDGGVKILKGVGVVDNYLDVLLGIYLDCAKRKGVTPLNPRTLLAHGISKGDKYAYFDLNEEGETISFPVQEWVDKHNGKHDALFIAVCNRENYDKIQSGNSLVIWPASRFNASPYGEMFDDVAMGAFLPEEMGLLNISLPKIKHSAHH